MVEKTPVKYNPVTHKHEPYGPGETIPAAMAPVRVGQTDYYPEAHISPPLLPGLRVWLNDPQPFLYNKATGQYHMWYLYNEDVDNETGTAWREVLTTDFVNFTDNGVRIPKNTTPYGDIWSGSAILDDNNYFGFGAGAVLYYVTMPCDKAGPGSQSVALWVARNGLGHDPEFINIVVPNPDGGAFRDPRVFYGEDNRTLYMVISTGNGVSTFSSTDGKGWTHVSSLALPGLGTIECPDIITLDGQKVLIFSANGFNQAPVTTQTMFLLINLNHGTISVSQNQPSDLRRMCVDTGPDFYAGRCGETPSGSVIMVGWANNWNYANNLPIADFNGTLALPRTLSLHRFPDGYMGVVGAPVAKQSSFYKRVVSQTNVTLSGDYSPIPWLDVPESSRIDFTIRKDPSNGWPSNFGMFIGSGDVKSFSTVISMTGDGSGTGKPYIENTRNDYGARPYYSIKEWNEYYRVYLLETGDTLTGTIIVDRGTAEVFINGVYSQTFQVLWPVGAQIMRLSIPQGYTLSGDFAISFNRWGGRVNGGFTRAHADSIYMFNTYPGVTSYDGDANNPHTHRILQIAHDDRTGPFFQLKYGGAPYNFWQLDPANVDNIVYTFSNAFAKPVKQIFIDSDPTKGIGVKTAIGGDTVYVPSQDQLATVRTNVGTLTNTVATQGQRITTNEGNIASLWYQNTQLNDTLGTLTSQTNQQITTLEGKVDANTGNISTLTDTVKTSISKIEGEVSSQGQQVTDTTGKVNSALSDIRGLQTRLLAGDQTASPNTAGNPNLMDRYALTQADVVKMLLEGAQQKAQGLAYAGKYALTPQNFYVNSDGVLRLTPYGAPPTDGVTTTPLESIGVPIITDSCYEFYDRDTGIWYRWDQFQHSSQSYKGVHWVLDGPVVSVSLDGLKWVTIRTLLYAQRGIAVWTAFWIDRDNRAGGGANALIVGNGGDTMAMPFLTAAAGTRIAGGMYGGGDFRLYWDPEIFQSFVLLCVDSTNTHLEVHSGKTLTTLNTSFTFDNAIFKDGRVECPSWVPMFDQVTGTKLQVLSVAVQRSSAAGYESSVLGAGTYTASGLTLSSDLRYVEWGADAYAQILVDPMQQDGTGGTRNGCDTAVYNVGSYHWSYINGNMSVPSFGYGGGQHITADVVLRNGIPMIIPNGKFKTACSGPSFTKTGLAQGSNAENPGWVLDVPVRSDVWRVEMQVSNFTFNGRSTIRFHFSNRYTDFIFGTGIVDYNPNNSGTTVLFPNNNQDTNRKMPLTRPFVSGSANTLVWEYDNGRIRLYNTATGEIMSEKIFPDGKWLTGIEIIGNDFFVGGFTMMLNQDGGTNY